VPTATRAASKADDTKSPEAPGPDDAPLDEKLVEQAVTFIRKTLAETLYKGATTVGDYVLESFFDNDPARVRSKNPQKNASFRSLAEKCGTADLPISKSWLHNAVGVAVMRRLLPEGSTAFKQLPPSHQATLLPLREPAKVEKLATRAVDKKLSMRDLREIVDGEVAKAKEGETRGRRPTPVILKTLNRSLKIFTLEGGKRSFTKAMVEELDEEQTKNALKSAQGLMDRLKDLVEKLKAKV